MVKLSLLQLFFLLVIGVALSACKDNRPQAVGAKAAAMPESSLLPAEEENSTEEEAQPAAAAAAVAVEESQAEVTSTVLALRITKDLLTRAPLIRQSDTGLVLSPIVFKEGRALQNGFNLETGVPEAVNDDAPSCELMLAVQHSSESSLIPQGSIFKVLSLAENKRQAEIALGETDTGSLSCTVEITEENLKEISGGVLVVSE